MKVDELKRMNLLEQDLIYPGYQLKVMHYRGDVPDGFYVFTKKDNLKKVCNKAGLTPEEFHAVNMSEGYTIQEGMLIKIQ